MKALVWHGKHHVSVDNVPDPKILNPGDAIIKVTTTCICGSDLHLYDGVMPTMEAGDIVGHEFMGEVVEIGSEVKKLKKGHRVVVPFTIACGNCFFSHKQLWSLCDNTNPNSEIAAQLMGHSPSGLFGYTHMMGGYAGGQAEYVRVPFADVGPFKVPDSLTDEQVVFLTDIYPTGYMAAENCNIQPGDTVAVWGAGPVGQFAVKSALLLGAEQVISIDNIPERLALAAEDSRVKTLKFDDEDLNGKLQDMTGGRGPDACIDAVGMEAHGTSPGELYDWAKSGLRMATDRPNVLRQAIINCRKGGTISVPGVYGGLIDKIPFGAAMNKGLTFKMGQTHVMRYLQPLLDHVVKGDIDPRFIITHRKKLADAPEMYEVFKNKRDGCIKVVLTP
jgi:threonine dehydrogenase-like Zn-dependent dehydrogenase